MRMDNENMCDKCVCSTCFYKEDCCPDCGGSILGCEEHSDTDIYKSE